ncbi:hypothetical protein [Nocardia sp. NPDC051463]|uniref:hypothetical protein n=1 Tax=Nocardia sp. NPDC051463 TaxID=3154845 RepID=UPI00344EA892
MENSLALDAVNPDDYDAVFLVGGQAPMYTFVDEPRIHDLVASRVADQAIQPFRIEDEARKLDGTNFIVAGRFVPHAVRDGNLITGQQQYSGVAAARLVIAALGV